jgi:hypothetical protein
MLDINKEGELDYSKSDWKENRRENVDELRRKFGKKK